MKIRLAHANSIIDIENSGGTNMVTGLPAPIMEQVGLIASQSAELTSWFTPKIEHLIVLSKNWKHQVGRCIFGLYFYFLWTQQISLMHEAEQYRHNTELLNHYIEQDLIERDEHKALIQAYCKMDMEEGSAHNE